MFVAPSIIATSEAALPPTSVACKARFRWNDSPPIYTFRFAPCVAKFLPRAKHASREAEDGRQKTGDKSD